MRGCTRVVKPGSKEDPLPHPLPRPFTAKTRVRFPLGVPIVSRACGQKLASRRMRAQLVPDKRRGIAPVDFQGWHFLRHEAAYQHPRLIIRRSPGSRMKMDEPHSVPFSDGAVEILREQRARCSASGFGPYPYVFARDRPRSPLTTMAMAMVLSLDALRAALGRLEAATAARRDLATSVAAPDKNARKSKGDKTADATKVASNPPIRPARAPEGPAARQGRQAREAMMTPTGQRPATLSR